ncbi:hypothetical protein [Streptomyces sp. DH8]|uniref:hypothetical protein n=1 Tax=Streptomyces sp. DH8 TaxID=2857008 RepID=UPI001E51F5C9|nr:hypothetical protein [Streptomyces sp. DH8]
MRIRERQPAAPAPAPTPSTPPSPPPPWAVRAARLIPLLLLPTGLWRLAMVCGLPSGYTATGFVPFETPGAKVWMLTLSVVCELLALLSLGLVRPWGETCPRWLPIMGGRPVRPLAAVVPAAAGALALTAIWAAMPWWWTYPHPDMTPAGSLLVGIIYQPLVLWGPLLGAVTLSYYRRTHPRRRRTLPESNGLPTGAPRALERRIRTRRAPRTLRPPQEPMAIVVAPGHTP